MKLNLATILSGFNLSKINNNFTAIENELQDRVLYRDNPVGEPNAMENVIDMNSNKIINLGAPTLPSDAARLVDVQDAIAGGTASLIPFTPYLDIVAINVQDAIEEVKDDVEAADVAITTKVSITSLAASAGAALVGFIQALTGSISRTVQSKLRDVVSVKDFGAVGDGVADDTVACQSAIATGKCVYFPQGTYRITAPLVLTTTLQRLYGDGRQSILRTDTDIETMNSANASSLFGIEVEWLTFHNTLSDASGGPTKFQLHFGTLSSGCIVRKCHFFTALTGSVVSIAHHAGLWFGGSNLNQSLDNTFGQAHILMESTDSTIRGGYVYSFAFEYAIKITSAGEVLVDGIRGILGGPSKGCIWIPNAAYMNKIVNNYFGGTYSTMNIGTGVFADKQQAMDISNNTFHEVDGIGIHLTDSAGGTTITGNNFFAGAPKQNDATGLIAGPQDIFISGVTYQAAGVTITGNSFNRFLGPIEDGMPGVGKSYAIEFAGASSTSLNVIEANTFTGASRYFLPAIETPASNHVRIGNIGSETQNLNVLPGDLTLGSTGIFLQKSVMTSFGAGGTLSFPINPGFGFAGILVVSNLRSDFFLQVTKTVYAVVATDATTLSLTSLGSQNGSGAAKSFTITMPSAGTLLFTDTSGQVTTCTMSFMGIGTGN